MNVKNVFCKIGMIPLIIVLSVGMLAGGFALAEDVGPQSPGAEIWKFPLDGNVYNDGASEIDFGWRFYEWVGTADYHTFGIYAFETTTNPFFTQSSDGPTSNFTTTITALQDITGETGDIYNPEYPTDNHTWIVPAGFPPGTYWATASFFNEESGKIETASTTVYVLQATGDLTVVKNEIGDENESWEFRIYGPDNPTSLYDSTTIVGDGSYTFTDIPVGVYVVREILLANWACTPSLPDAGHYTDPDVEATVIFNDETTVTFENEPQVGNLVIHKATDPTGMEADWTFSISGPTSDSDSTDGGTVTFSGIPVGSYDIQESIKAGWVCTEIYEDVVGDGLDYDGDPDDGHIEDVDVVIGATTHVYYTNQQLGAIRIFKYNDENNNGTQDGLEAGLAGWDFTVSGVSGTWTTDGGGYVTVPNLTPGSYTVTETLKAYWVNTEPGVLTTDPFDVGPGETVDVVFGNYQPERVVPTLGQWGIIIMSAVFVALLVWVGVRRRRLALG